MFCFLFCSLEPLGKAVDFIVSFPPFKYIAFESIFANVVYVFGSWFIVNFIYDGALKLSANKIVESSKWNIFKFIVKNLIVMIGALFLIMLFLGSDIDNHLPWKINTFVQVAIVIIFPALFGIFKGLNKKGKGVYDYEQAFELYKKATVQNDTTSQYNLGKMYSDDFNKNAGKDYEQAIYWYEKAAEQENVGAQLNLADIYYEGGGVPQDYKQSFKWYLKAAKHGHKKAQFHLGLMYGKGDGVPQDDINAMAWFILATAPMREEGKTMPSSFEEINGKIQDNYIGIRDLYAKELSPERFSKAQALAANLQKELVERQTSGVTRTTSSAPECGDDEMADEEKADAMEQYNNTLCDSCWRDPYDYYDEEKYRRPCK